MKSLAYYHLEVAGDPGVSPRLKPFKNSDAKLSSTWKGLLALGVFSFVTGLAPQVMAQTITRGAVGPSVALIQSQLGIPADGIYGHQTASAVAAYQRACGLLVDGIAGPQTISSLSSGSCGCNTSCYSSGHYQQGGYYPNRSAYRDDGYSGPPSSSYTRPPVYIQPGPHPPLDTGYVVVVPGSGENLLSRVQQYGFPQAAIDGADWGAFINVGTYPTRADAIYVANRLKGFGFSAQVAYRGKILQQSQ